MHAAVERSRARDLRELTALDRRRRRIRIDPVLADEADLVAGPDGLRDRRHHRRRGDGRRRGIGLPAGGRAERDQGDGNERGVRAGH